MAQLKSTVVQGSLRVTDTTYTTDLILSGSKTARYALIAPTSAGTPTWRALTKADISDFPTNLNQFTNGPGYVTSSGVTSITIKTTSPLSGGSDTATTSTGTYTLSLGTVGVGNGGTGNTSFTQWGVIYANPATKLVSTAAGTSGYLLQGNGAAAPSWIQATNSNTASTIVKRDSSGNFSAGTITANLTGNVTGNVSGSSGSCTGNAATATKWASAQTVYVALGTASKTTTIQGGNSNAVALGIDGTLAIGHGGTGITTTDAHKVLIGPSSGNAAAPTWRTIVAADLPTATTSALGIMQVGTGLGVSSGTVSVSYGTSANTALQGNASLVKLNGLTKTAASMADFYAPTSAGTNGQFLKSIGSGEPTWSALPTASTTVAGIVKLGASGGAATYEHTHSEYAKIKSFSASWTSQTSIAIADSWITEEAAVVATDLQTKNLPGIVTWTITNSNITFTCTVAASSSTIGEFHFLMIKP